MKDYSPLSLSGVGWFVSSGILQSETLPNHLRSIAESLIGPASEGEPGVVVARATELLLDEIQLPDWAEGAYVKYLVVLDLPEPAAMMLPSRLGLHKPHLRLHVTRDWNAPRRLVLAQRRNRPFEGLVDAYVLGQTVVVVLGSMEIRWINSDEIPVLNELTMPQLADFEIDIDGSYLYWPARDLHLGASQLLREVDPEYYAELEIERIGKDVTGAAVAQIREHRGLRQEDIAGLSERQVRRIEKGVSRLTLDAAKKLAAAFDTSLEAFLGEIARRAGRLHSTGSRPREKAFA